MPTTSSPLFGQGFWLFSCFLQWALHSFHLGDLFDLDNLSDLLCLIHLVFFFLSFPPSGSVLHELVTCVYLVMNSSSLDTTLKSDISRGFTVRFQDFFNIFCGFLRLPLALYMRCDLLCDDRCLVMVLGFQCVGLLWPIPTDGCGRRKDHGSRQTLEEWDVHHLVLNVGT